MLWQVKDLGGYSTPSVVGSLYLMSNRGMENEFVQTLSTQDGKVIWTSRVGNVGNPNQDPPYPKARSTPTVDGNFVYALGSDGDFVCLEDYLKGHPEHAEWAFSVIEITRSKAFLIDGRAPSLPKNGGIGLWFAPVDPTQLSKEIGKDRFDSIIGPSLGSVLGLGIWIPDREYVAYMRARGHH